MARAYARKYERRNIPVGHRETSSRSSPSSSDSLILVCSAMVASGICCSSRCSRSLVPNVESIAHPAGRDTQPATIVVGGGEINPPFAAGYDEIAAERVAREDGSAGFVADERWAAQPRAGRGAPVRERPRISSE